MKPALSSCFSLLTCVLVCWALNGTEGSFCTKEALYAKGLTIPIDEEPRQVAVWTENGNIVKVYSPGVTLTLTSSQGKWHNFTANQNGSEYCVSSKALAEDSCDEDSNQLILWSTRETKWNLEPANMTSGCRQYYLLRIDLDLHDSPTKLLWRPGKRAMSLRFYVRGSGFLNIYTFRKADSQLQYDMTIRRASGDAPCVVTSATLDVAHICQINQTGISTVFIDSLDGNQELTPSYFSFDCEDDADQESDSDVDWEVLLVLLNVIILVLLLETIFI